jgi:probable rRNA maturation factor
MRPISIANRHPRLRLDRRAVARLFATLDTHYAALAMPRSSLGDPAALEAELSVVFLTDAALAQLHADFLDDPTTTDVITFEGNPVLGTAGEICVSVDTAARYAREHRRDFSAELTLYLVHGWLHLAGHDDLVPAKKRAMRRAEARALRLLERDDALPRFSLKSPLAGSPAAHSSTRRLNQRQRRAR